MKGTNRILLAGCFGLIGLAGCGHHHHVEVEAEPAPIGYVYEPGYYDRGYYRDNDWYWNDRGGHLYHESRDEHERRSRNSDGHRENGDHHEQGGH